MLRFLIAALVGSAVGAAMGFVCAGAGGTCPLVGDWGRGALTGGVTGLLVAWAGRVGSAPARQVERSVPAGKTPGSEA